MVARYGLKTRSEVFKTPRDKAKAQAVAKRLLGRAPVLEYYRSTEPNQAHASSTKIVKLLKPGQPVTSAEPWVWRDSSWMELWAQVDGFTCEKRVRGEDAVASNQVFVWGDEELEVYTRQEHATCSFNCEKHGYLAITMAGYGVLAVVALRTATHLKGRNQPERFKFWDEQLVALGVGDAATEQMLQGTKWLVCPFLSSCCCM